MCLWQEEPSDRRLLGTSPHHVCVVSSQAFPVILHSPDGAILLLPLGPKNFVFPFTSVSAVELGDQIRSCLPDSTPRRCHRPLLVRPVSSGALLCSAETPERGDFSHSALFLLASTPPRHGSQLLCQGPLKSELSLEAGIGADGRV